MQKEKKKEGKKEKKIFARHPFKNIGEVQKQLGYFAYYIDFYSFISNCMLVNGFTFDQTFDVSIFVRISHKYGTLMTR